MKKAFALILSAVLLCGCGGGIASETSPSLSVEAVPKADGGYGAVNYSYMRAMWLSQYDLCEMLTDGGTQRERRQFTDMISRALDKIKELGINTVIVQVRPFGDSFYPSEYFPMSALAVGKWGGDADYDAFGIIVDQAHSRGLSIHGWINPLRAMGVEEVGAVDSDYAVREWYEEADGRVVNISGRLYLNPAYREVRELVCNGAAEIVRKYKVDGIHIDDYFYPTTDVSFDEAAYVSYRLGGGRLSLADFRREQINRLVGEIYAAVKTENESVLFGVSPSGVMKNNYELLYADVAKWCTEEGYVDYICPQIYFGFEHSTCPFDRVCDEFAALVKGREVRLVVGLSLSKAAEGVDAYAGEGMYEWRDNKDIIKRSLEKIFSVAECDGFSLFSYRLFYDPISGESVQSTSEERAGFARLLKS